MKFRYLQVYLCLIDARSKAVEYILRYLMILVCFVWDFLWKGKGCKPFSIIRKDTGNTGWIYLLFKLGNKVWDFELLKLILKEEMNLSKVCSFHVHVQNDLIETLSVKMYRNSFPQFTWYVNLSSFYWKPVKLHLNVESKQSQN